ncbi:ferrous iron efflux protein F [compost metagenome]
MVQMHVDLDPDLSLKAAHDIILEAEKRVLKAFPHADILIHADPRGAAEPHGGAFASPRPTAPERPVEAVAPEAPSVRTGPWS